MAEGVDYAFSRPDPAGLFAAGKRFAMRYIGPGTDDKHLHAGERDALWAAGLDIALLAEGAANSALGGFSTGQSQASSALSAARALGAPDSLPIYFAVDFDVTSSQWPTVAQYFNGVASAIGASRAGIYGGIRAMQWAARDGVAAWFFQTFAWSSGQWYPGNHVEQYQNDLTLAGGTVDLCRSTRANYGQWGPNGPPQTRDGDMPAFVHCQQNGGYYAFGLGGPKWYTSVTAFNDARAVFGATTVEVATLDQLRNTFGYIPGSADAVAAGTADVVADAHGNVIPTAGGGGGGTGPTAADIAKAVNDEASRRLAG